MRRVLNIGILASEGSWYYRDLERAARARGHACQRLEFGRIVSVAGRIESGVRMAERHGNLSFPSMSGSVSQSALRCLHSLDVIFVRTMPPGSLEQVVYRMDALERLATAGTKIVNSPKSVECAVDKYLTTARLHDAGLPVPETIVCEHEEDAMEAFVELGSDVVVKPLFGAEGRGIVRVSDVDLAHRTFRTLMRLNAVLYLQRFIDHEGFDVRVLVMNGTSLGAIRRRSLNDFRTNVSRNATPEKHEATAQEIDFAVKASAITGTFIAGVDLLYDRAGRCHVIEVNAVPGWQAFAKTTGVDVAARLIQTIDQ